LDIQSDRTDTQVVSPAQMNWLKTELSRSKATFKIILNSQPIADKGAWRTWPAQRSELINHIHDSGTRGVLFLTGDAHIGLISRVDPPQGPLANSWEIYVGPGGSSTTGWGNVTTDFDVKWEALTLAQNYVLLEADPSRGTVRI